MSDDPVDVVRSFWAHVQDRSWGDVRRLLHDDIVLEYPVTDERFVGADNVLAINTEYPDGWTIDIRGLWAEASDVLALVRVPLGEDVAWCTQRSTVTAGRIVRATELWSDEGSEAPPDWRSPYRSPSPTASNEDS